MIKKTDMLGEIMEKYPEVAPVLAGAGLHCIGCHTSAYETIEQGCLAHGMKKKEVDELIKSANSRILEYDKLQKVSFTEGAFLELSKRLKKSNKKFVQIAQNFGEFDFLTVDKKEAGVIELPIEGKSGKIVVLLPLRTERLLRGVKIDFDKKLNDFSASRI
jgi:hybrid cluster-associated redox disulfide protein